MLKKPTKRVQVKFRTTKANKREFERAAKAEGFDSMNDFYETASLDRVVRKQVEAKDGVVAYEG